MAAEIIEQPDQYQLILRTRIEPQFDCLSVLTEIVQAQIAVLAVFAAAPVGTPFRPMHDADAIVAGGAWAEMSFEFMLRWRRSPAETEKPQSQYRGREAVSQRLRQRLARQSQWLHR